MWTTSYWSAEWVAEGLPIKLQAPFLMMSWIIYVAPCKVLSAFTFAGVLVSVISALVELI